jgi:hypothetical protein
MIEKTSGPRVTNALLRCVRQDSLEHPLFECANSELRLWVWEIPTAYGITWDQWMDETIELLSSQASFLSTLCSGSSDYTLFVEVANSTWPIRISQPLLAMAVAVGFEVEVYFAGE